MNEKMTKEAMYAKATVLLSSVEYLKMQIENNDDLVSIGFQLDRVESETEDLVKLLNNCTDY